MFQIDHLCDYEYLRRRASQHVWHAYKVNSYELQLLMAFAGVLFKQGRRAISRADFMNNLTGNQRYKGKMNGYWAGLVNKGILAEAETIQGFASIYITAIGSKCLELFARSLNDLEAKVSAKYPPEKKKAVYTYDKISPTVIGDLGIGYRRFKPVADPDL